MSYLKFDRNSMSNLEVSLDREILRTNRRGAYHCSTILGCNTRKYHGLLVVPIHKLSPYGHVLLSSFNETVIQHGAEFNLALHKYQGDTFAPNGHKYIREYEIDTIPRIVYRVGGVVLSKELLFSFNENRLIIRYTLLQAHSKTILRFSPFLAFRSVKELTHENSSINWNYNLIDNGVSMCLYPGYPNLNMQFSKPVEWHYEPHWYKNFMYDKEKERGHAYVEDLPVPGFFECEIQPGEQLYFSAGDMPIKPDQINTAFEEALNRRVPRTSFTNSLVNAADQFFYKPDAEHAYLIAGYPWYGVRARDQFIALTGCTFGIQKPERYDAIMNTAWPAILRFMKEGLPDSIIEGIELPDTLLWVINAIQDYSRWRSMAETKEKYGAYVAQMIDYLLEDRHPSLKLAPNGLLYAVAPEGKPITWMDSTIDDYPVVDRQGYIVEYNALWYNALCFYRDLFNSEDVTLTDLIDRVAESFIRVFVNDKDYLFDYVCEGRPQDWSVRPNMIFAVGLKYSPLSRKLQRSVLDIVTKELLTPKGLRTLTPKSPYYRGYCNGVLRDRAYAAFQGAVWSWLMYPYLSAYFKLFKKSGISFVEKVLIPFESELSLHGIGTISEMYDPTPPFRGRGAISFATSVSAILRIQNRLFDVYNDENELLILH